MRLVARFQRFTDKINKKKDYRSVRDAEGTAIYDRKIKADADLNRAKTRFRKKSKRKGKKGISEITTSWCSISNLKSRFSKAQKLTPRLIPPVYQIRERAALIPLICRFKADLTVKKKHARRLECIRL
jgi:hypothetical protein